MKANRPASLLAVTLFTAGVATAACGASPAGTATSDQFLAPSAVAALRSVLASC